MADPPGKTPPNDEGVKAFNGIIASAVDKKAKEAILLPLKEQSHLILKDDKVLFEGDVPIDDKTRLLLITAMSALALLEKEKSRPEDDTLIPVTYKNTSYEVTFKTQHSAQGRIIILQIAPKPSA